MPVAAETDEYAKPVSNRLNVTGRAITIDVPLKNDGRSLGDVVIRILPTDEVLVSRGALVDVLGTNLSDQAKDSLQKLSADDGFVRLASLSDAGFDAHFDSATQEVAVGLSVEQRPVGEIAFGQGHSASSRIEAPARFSGYLNIIAGVDYAWDGNSGGGNSDAGNDTAARFEFESVVRTWNTVLETRAAYDGAVDVNVCPIGAICVYDHAAGIKRQTTRLTHDLPDLALRLGAGDLEPLGTGIQRRPELLGLSIEKSGRRLNPGKAHTSLGSGSLRIDRPSDVEVLINGASIQRMQLRPGVYNLRDLPLVTGANNVEFVITDDLGSRSTERFSTYHDQNLLAEGESEWGANGGLPSYLFDQERVYVDDVYVASGFYRYGLTTDVTVEAHAQADNNVVMAGGGVLTQSLFGVFGLQGAASTGDFGTGYATDFNWDLINFSGLLRDRGESFQLHAEYRSTKFHTPGEYLSSISGIIFPEYPYWLRLDASYSTQISDAMTMTLATRYQFADPDRFSYSQHVIERDRYGADITLSRPLSEASSASLTLGWSNESYLQDFNADDGSDPEFRFAVRYNLRTADGTSIYSGYDSLNRQGDVSANRSSGNGVGSWDTTVHAQQDPYNDRVNADGSIGYRGNRAEVRVTHISGFTGLGYGSIDPRFADQRTLLRIGSSIAFADGHVAVGAPVRSGAFAIVYPHESLGSNEIAIGPEDFVRAKTDFLGPALVTDIPSYVPNTMPIEVADLPIGYNLGTGAFDTYAPNKAGYALQVGSGYSVSAYGTLLARTGEPVALQTGIAYPADAPDTKVAVFTNSAGRFGAEGLAPGKWIIEMEGDEGKTSFEINVPIDATGLFKAGTLSPSGAS